MFLYKIAIDTNNNVISEHLKHKNRAGTESSPNLPFSFSRAFYRAKNESIPHEVIALILFKICFGLYLFNELFVRSRTTHKLNYILSNIFTHKIFE